MSDIKQAGEWLERGKQVRRSTWLHNARLSVSTKIGSFIILLWDEGPVTHESEFIIGISDLITDDWEIAE